MSPAGAGPLRVAFRVDASLAIGTGHVMRCLTLADALRARGATCRFIGRPHPGHLLDAIARRGHEAVALPPRPPMPRGDGADDAPAHAAWLGTDRAVDAADTLAAIGPGVDWLVVDHYALDARWERLLRPACRRLLVIDDLADRSHDCDLLLDQNLGRTAAHYQPLVGGAALLVGPRHALLRPEFAHWRPRSLGRRGRAPFERLLIALGGVDRDNATGRVLQAIARSALAPGLRATVVMGGQAPWLEAVRRQALSMPCPTQVEVDVQDMARHMAEADLAIGAAGGSAWERCCLGLPSLLVLLADNQRAGAQALAAAGAAAAVFEPDALEGLAPVLERLHRQPEALLEASRTAGKLTDGLGVARLMQRMEACDA